MTSAASSEASVATRPASIYRAALSGAFTLFNAGRMFAYLPTIWIIVSGQDSSQHSLWTWCVLLGANATMATWQWENARRTCDRVVLVNASNTLMCLSIVTAIVWTRV